MAAPGPQDQPPPQGPPDAAPPNPYAPPPAGTPLLPPAARQPPTRRVSPPPRREPRPQRPSGPRPVPPGLRALTLALVGVVLALLLPPWSFAGVVVGVAAVVLGVRSRRVVQAPARAPVATAAVVTGLVASLLAGSLSIFGLVYREQLDAYRECVRGANTEAARAQCQQLLNELRDDVVRGRR